ncbi:ABC transporter family substrate-binding protein [Streptomyces alboniger]|uniref:ABC transporter family substrate-binding protein n=1 Tax=Streptomyces alboniger TaxID=132473 RepID=A0A5J6HIK8_STRAD|nr:ABC transporter family substrate-binding protein [Streptomyces alboniger]QEV20026.1 ABC transporter family substrate-binding protein [Streptomyces alboniger]
MSHDRVRARSVVFLATGVLALPTLAGCSSNDEAGRPTAGQDVAPAARDMVADGGTMSWALDALPETLNTFQADADAGTSRVAGAVLPSLFRLDAQGRTQRNADFLESAKVVEREPQQVVLYKLNQQAVWSDGREIGADDFAAQWRALSGKDTAYWTARNAGYDRIEKIERGANNLEVRVTFARPYADWRALFSPLYPKQVMGSPDTFNDGARRKLKVTAGPFALADIDRRAGEVTLGRNPRWWGRPAKLDKLVLREVPRTGRAEALAKGKVDLAEIDSTEAGRITLAGRDKGGGQGPLAHGPGAQLTPAKALRSWAIVNGSDEEAAAAEAEAREATRTAVKKYANEQAGLSGYVVRKSLEPAYTQLALNGSEGPLADDRVRRAVARALDREALAEAVLKPLGLPAEPVGSHLALAGQQAYADNSGALGEQDTAEARALLADAGWTPGGALKDKLKEKKPKTAGGEAGTESGEGSGQEGQDGQDTDDGTYIVGEDDGKPADNSTYVLAPGPAAAYQRAALTRQADVLGLPGEADTTTDAKKKTDAKQKAAVKKAAAKKAAAEKAAAKKKSTKKNSTKKNSPKNKNVKKNSAEKVSAKKKDAADHTGPHDERKSAVKSSARDQAKGGAPGAYAPKGTAAPAAAVGGPLAKDGKPLTLRFVLPSGEGSESLRTVADRISRMLERIGVRTETAKVSDTSYFKDHIASGQYDLALYSWPASAFPATDARPIFAKPVPAADGSLNVEQNYTRVGTDHIDQLFDQAMGELDEETSRSLVRKADARIWAEAGSIPLYQRPQLMAARPNLANAGAFGFQAPHYEDIGFLKPGAKPSGSPSAK